MVLITELPPEIIHNVLRFVDPPDLAWIPRISKTFLFSTRSNPMLFRNVYLAHFDTPPTNQDVNWEQLLKDAVRLQVVCRRPGVENKVWTVYPSEILPAHVPAHRSLSGSSTDGRPAWSGIPSACRAGRETRLTRLPPTHLRNRSCHSYTAP